MSERSRRFRRLGPETADLFEHFGIDLDPPRSVQGHSPPATEARACRGCGWYVTQAEAAAPCTVCLEPGPWGDAPPAEPAA